ncbi:APC family permease [Amycolatopsis taiwanensis]|uniref:APC family permease n=1 Tax=Amycolatopsis taiwanensis TaxID=342230 RepID=UPI002556D930|nr:APC family permease [Amycolatopsis taiwanensis]
MADGATPGGLNKGVLGQGEVIFQAVSHLGPALGIIVIGPALAGLVGMAVPLILVMALVAVLLTGLCVSALARKLPSSGGYYSYVSHGLGERAGFVTAWAYFLYDPLIPTIAVLFTAGILDPVIEQNLGIHVPWWVIVLVLLAVVHFATVRGIQPSARLTVAVGALESLIIVAFAIVLILRNGSPAFSLEPFRLPTGSDTNTVFLAFAFGVLLFTGFESAAPLAEETANPRRAIPRTVVISIIAVGLIWVLAGYAMVTSWGSASIGDIGEGENAFFALADRFSGWAWLFLAFALLNSSLATALAGQNAGARVLYTLGRNGILPRRLARLHPKHRTPVGALTLTMLLNVAVCLGVGFWLTPTGAFSFVGLFVTLGVIVVYVLGNLSVIRLFRTRHRPEWNFIRHGVIPVAASAILLVGLYYTVWPLPEWPLNLAAAIVGGWLLLGLVVSFVLWRTRREGLTSAARLLATDTPESLTTERHVP